MPFFVGAIPDGTRLHLVVTPMIASDLSPALELQWREMVEGWELSAGSAAQRLMLPPTLPRTAFATRTHLNAGGVEQSHPGAGGPLEGSSASYSVDCSVMRMRRTCCWFASQ